MSSVRLPLHRSRASARCYSPSVTTPSLLDGDPGCPSSGTLVAVRRPFAGIDPETWDRLVDRSPAATPFSRHCVERAWWAAYGATAHDQTMVVVREGSSDEILAVAPLMHRHELEPGDLAAKTALRHDGPPGTSLPESATAVFFGASYHSDYATLLAPPEALPDVARVVVETLAARDDWDVVDLRRLRAIDPSIPALEAAFRERAASDGWRVVREQEDVCPVVTLPDAADFDGYLGTLDKKERHEIRRKVRRAEAAGEVRLEPSADPGRDMEAFVDLHQKRWGEDGLFPETEGGAASRGFFAGLLEGCSDFVELSFLTVGGRRIAAGVTFDDGETLYYYTAGVDPEARELSPGVVMVARYVERAISLGRKRLDFLRGDEPYKYAWGAVDEPIERLLVERSRPSRGEEGRA